MFRILLILLISSLTLSAQAKDTHSKVWAEECEFCHLEAKDFAVKTGKKTRQYLFNYIYNHTNDENQAFSNRLSRKEINDLAIYILVLFYVQTLSSEKDHKDVIQYGL
jgi:hypothetical protein